MVTYCRIFGVVFWINLLFALHVFSMNYVENATRRVDELLTSCIHSLAESRPCSYFCDFLLSVAQDVDSCKSFKGKDWYDVARASYEAGLNPNFKFNSSLVGCLGLLASKGTKGLEKISSLADSPAFSGGVQEYTLPALALAPHRESLLLLKDASEVAYIEQNPSIFSNYLAFLIRDLRPSPALTQVVHASTPKEFIRLIDDFIIRTEPQKDWTKFTLNNDVSDAYRADQCVYGSILSVTTQVVADLITCGTPYPRLQAVAGFGRTLANLYDSEHGSIRRRQMLTPTGGIYADLAERFEEAMSEWKIANSCLLEFDGEWPSFSKEYFEIDMMLKSDKGSDIELPEFSLITSKAKISGVVYPLSQFVLVNGILSKVLHTPFRVCQRINYGADLFNQLINDALTLKEERAVIEKLGEFFWWFCKIKPLVNGDPSVAEILVKAVLSSKNFEVPGWQPKTTPWVEVELECDPRKFGKKFYQLLKY